MRIELTVPGEPVAQPRLRHASIRGKARGYLPDDHPVHGYKSAIQWSWPREPRITLDGPVAVEIGFVFPRPKGKVWKSKPMDSYPHTAKPDIDNLVKAVLDALTRAGAWKDDAQVSYICAAKRVASGSEEPHTIIRVFPWRVG